MSGEAESYSVDLNVNGLSLSFGGLKALTNVSFSVAPGSITAVIGPNGAGKTSLFNCISGFYRPSAGAIEFAGEDISKLHPPARAKIGLDNIKLGRHAHMQTNVLDALWYFGRARREELALRSEIEQRVLNFLEMEHIRDQPVASLSYGLRKRVELARALAMQPRLLMLDEPVAGMNREETEDMARFILDVKEEWGVTILLADHDMGLVMDISDHVVVLNFGQVIAAGKPAEIQNNPNVIAAYLGSGDVGDLSRRIAGERAA